MFGPAKYNGDGYTVIVVAGGEGLEYNFYYKEKEIWSYTIEYEISNY